MKKLASQVPKPSIGNKPPKLSREISTGEIKPLTSLATEFLQSITYQAPSTQIIYARALRQITEWIEEKPGGTDGFRPELLTSTALTLYLEELAAHGYSLSHRARIKAVVSRFARWLMEEKSLLASGLNLIVAAIVLWNTVYLQKAIERLEERNAPIPEQYLPHLSPMLWDHIPLTGEYFWRF
ncbi:MAG: Tn3 family transposase [bacterium]